MAAAHSLESKVMAALSAVDDPELGVSIVELGLVCSLEISEGRIAITLMMTTPTCPLGQLIAEMATAAVEAVAGSGWSIEVDLDRLTPWTPSMASDAVRHRFGPPPAAREGLAKRAGRMLGWA